MLKGRMAAGGIMVTQSTSPYFAPKAYWCIKHTLDSVFHHTIPYQTNVPSFGIWGFVMAGGAVDKVFSENSDNISTVLQTKIAGKLKQHQFADNLKYFSAQKIPAMLYFEKDLQEIPTEINTLSTQKLVEYYYKSADNWR
jgi:spermidine synthase